MTIIIIIIINTYLATCFGSGEPSSGQFFTYRYGAFNECAHYGIPYKYNTSVDNTAPYLYVQK